MIDYTLKLILNIWSNIMKDYIKELNSQGVFQKKIYLNS